jgi:L-cysteine:1D-myo-inositol 2-amino-2-deoxy-alpha-D-glucopyranoside ligase
MRAWTSPDLPDLETFGPAPDLRLHDSSTGETVATPSGRPGDAARLYVCGITPYDATHMGHAATYLAFDLAYRGWRDAGHDVHYVQNVTDIDDPLLERAQQTGEAWDALAEREVELFRRDMTALRVLPPHALVGAVESIPEIVEMIHVLRERGAVYDVEGDLYFSVHADPRFGEISGLDETSMVELFGERGGDPDRPGKKHPLDCLLWQTERPGEPAWDSTLGRGRPGWHVECAAIARTRLGVGFDVQGGGSDLVFPHHEMSAAEAQAAFPESTFAQAYVHAGMVGYQGEKMSKSKGNLVLVSSTLASGVDPMAVRLALLAHHYRSDWEWTDRDLVTGRERLARWRAAAEQASTSDVADLVPAVRRALASDLDAPAAVAAIDAWAARPAPPGAEAGSGSSALRTLLDARLGVEL